MIKTFLTHLLYTLIYFLIYIYFLAYIILLKQNEFKKILKLIIKEYINTSYKYK